MVNKSSLLKIVQRLVTAIGPSGFEDEVRDVVVSELKPYADSIWIDTFGNVIAVKKGTRGGGKVMLIAHMDEAGLVITNIDEKGFIKFTTIGNLDKNTLPGQRVIILTRNSKRIRGVIGYKALHSERVMKIENLFIDIGASNAEEVKILGIEPGCVAVLDRDLTRLGSNDIISSRALDNRIGLASMIETFKNIDNVEPDVYAVATIQEKTSIKGSTIISLTISPQVAIAIDTTIATDVLEDYETTQKIQLGKGVVIKVVSKEVEGEFIIHQVIKNSLIKIAEEEKIPYQIGVSIMSTIDTSVIDLYRKGALVGIISIPIRYLHSAIEVANLNDAVNASRLVTAFIKRITSKWIEKYLIRKLK